MSPSWEAIIVMTLKKGSIQHTNPAATCTCPEPEESSLYPTILLFKGQFKVIFTSTLVSSWISPSLRLSYQNNAFTVLLFIGKLQVILISPWVNHSSYIWQEVQIWKLFFMPFFQPPFTSSLLGPNIFQIALFPSTFSLRSFLNVKDQVLHPWKSVDKNTISYISARIAL
jgi:hypothetical protein